MPKNVKVFGHTIRNDTDKLLVVKFINVKRKLEQVQIPPGMVASLLSFSKKPQVRPVI